MHLSGVGHSSCTSRTHSLTCLQKLRYTRSPPPPFVADGPMGPPLEWPSGPDRHWLYTWPLARRRSCFHAYRNEAPISSILWQMRLQHQQMLEHYTCRGSLHSTHCSSCRTFPKILSASLQVHSKMSWVGSDLFACSAFMRTRPPALMACLGAVSCTSRLSGALRVSPTASPAPPSMGEVCGKERLRQFRVSVGALTFGVGGRRRSLPCGEPLQDTRMRVRWKRWMELGHVAAKSRLELWQ